MWPTSLGSRRVGFNVSGGEDGGRTRFEPVGKPDGGVRWISHLAPAEGASYHAAVAPLVGVIEDALGPEVLASRGHVQGGRRVVLEPWRVARRSFESTARVLATRSEAVARTDVRRCFASIRDGVLERRLRALGAPARDVSCVVAALQRLHAHGVAGLPVGPEPSAILANAVLARVDEELRRAGARWLRWVDDLLLFARSEREAERMLDVAGEALGSVRLERAEHKTAVLEGGPTFARSLRAHGLSGVKPHL